MSSLKILLATSALAIVSAAQAAPIATFNVSESFVSASFGGVALSGASHGIGTATLDSSGVLTMSTTEALYLDFSAVYGFITDVTALGQSFVLNTTDSYNLNSAGSTQAFRSGTCVASVNDSMNTCNIITYDTPQALNGPASYYSSQGFTLAGGSFNLQWGGAVTENFTLTPTVPAPAAAWLFGSGLIGLVGATRRRNKSA